MQECMQHAIPPNELKGLGLNKQRGSAAPQGQLVEQVLGQLVFGGLHLGEVGDVVAHLLHGLHLLVQVMGLQEVAQVGVGLVGGHLVQVQQGLVHGHLQLQGALHGLQTAAPLVPLGFLDVLQENASPSLGLKGHQLLGVLPLLLAVLLEEVRESRESHVIPLEIVSHRHVSVGCEELHINHPVNCCFAVAVVILADLRSFHLVS
uniref:Uncharacterized protein n=1 Tax=Anguilla anguilla TaxID=7936 RepID=A0A0E9WQG9_ANGAN